MYTHRSVKAVEYMVRIKKILLELQWDWCFVILFIFSFHYPTFQIEFCYFIIPSLSLFLPLMFWLPFALSYYCPFHFLSFFLSFLPSFFLSNFQTFSFRFFLSFLLSIILSHLTCFLLYFNPDFTAVAFHRLFFKHFRSYISTTFINASSLFPSISFFLPSFTILLPNIRLYVTFFFYLFSY